MGSNTRKIDLFGTVYTIKFVNDLIELGEGNLGVGVTDHVNHTITISTSAEGNPLPESEIQLTLYHELFHAFLHTGQYLNENLDEPLVEWLARCLNQCIKKGII